jgi:hypothetical protein
MKFLWGSKDGGPESNVRMWGFEWKQVCSILILNFGKGSREAFHTHAFNSISWVLTGGLLEYLILGGHIMPPASPKRYPPSLKPAMTTRSTFHKVEGMTDSNWVITFRGPWVDKWREYLPNLGKFRTLTHGRKEIA